MRRPLIAAALAITLVTVGTPVAAFAQEEVAPSAASSDATVEAQNDTGASSEPSTDAPSDEPGTDTPGGESGTDAPAGESETAEAGEPNEASAGSAAEPADDEGEQTGQSEQQTDTRAAAKAAVQAAAETPSCPEGMVAGQALTENTNGVPNTSYSFCSPETVVVGEDIVLMGTGGYFGADGITGSVMNFFVDAEVSGDPNTLYTKRTLIHPETTNEEVVDKRSHAMVKAKSDGTWEARIPFPNSINSRTLSGTGNVDELWAAGTTHSIRMLSGTLLKNGKVDQRRFVSVFFDIVAASGDVVRPSEPSYQHYTYNAPASGGNATAWLQKNVSAGSTARLTGRNWLTGDKMQGSRIEIRLVDQAGKHYERDTNSTIDDDPTLWQIVYGKANGDLSAAIELPSAAKAGSYVAVKLLTSSKGLPGDLERSWTSAPITIAGQPYVPPKPANASCKASPGRASYTLAPGMSTPAANIGGTIRLTGKNWCNLVGTGSLIAVKIDAGAYSHKGSNIARLYSANKQRVVGDCKAGICASNKTIWFVIEAADDGSFDVEIPVPNRNNSTPKFTTGQYTLQLLTRTIAADPYYKNKRLDPSRTIKTEPFTVVAENKSLTNVQPGQPRSAPDVLHVSNALRSSAKGGVRITQNEASWMIKIPRARPGEWVYINVFDGSSARSPWGSQWFRVSGDRTVTVPTTDVTLPSGRNKLSVQNSTGGLLGWNYVTVAAARQQTVAVAQVSSTPPDAAPAAPVKRYAQLTPANRGSIEAVLSDGTLRLTLPGSTAGDWVYLHFYVEPKVPDASGESTNEATTDTVIDVGWVQVGSDLSFTVQLGELPAGQHKLSVVNADGELLGWVTVDGGEHEETSAEQLVQQQFVRPAAAGIGSTHNGSLSLVLMGLGVLLLAACGAGAIALRSPAAAKQSPGG